MFILKQDFQHLDSTNQLHILKAGTRIDKLEGNFYLIIKSRKKLQIPKDVVEKNPDFFEKIDLRTQLQNIIKKNKSRTAPKLAEIIELFLEDEYFSGKDLVDIDTLRVMLEACRQKYMETEDDTWLEPIQKLGWNADGKGVYKD